MYCLRPPMYLGQQKKGSGQPVRPVVVAARLHGATWEAAITQERSSSRYGDDLRL